MDFNCIYHLIAYRKDKPDILVKEALDLLLSVGKTPERARDTLTGILSVGAGDGPTHWIKKVAIMKRKGDDAYEYNGDINAAFGDFYNAFVSSRQSGS